jgi:hypothetical protein
MNSAYRLAKNIIRSIQTLIGNTITVNATAYPVYPNWAFADAELQADTAGTPSNAFCVLDWPVLLAGHGGYHQLDVYVLSRIGDKGDADADPFGSRALDMLEIVHYALGTSRDRACFAVLDYTDDPEDPEDTGHWGLVEGRGQMGQPEMVESFDSIRGYVGFRAVYKVFLANDKLREPGHYYENNPD